MASVVSSASTLFCSSKHRPTRAMSAYTAYAPAPVLTRSSFLPSRAVCRSAPRQRFAARKPIHPLRSHHWTPAKLTISEGATAPDFTRTDGDGNEITLSNFRGARNVVLYFSNGFGPICTNQSCIFRDAADEFDQLDAEVIAVSARRDTRPFKRGNRLPFSVIPDPQGELQKLYGVSATLGVLPGRVTYVIDKQGVVRSAYDSQFTTGAHVKMAADALKAFER